MEKDRDLCGGRRRWKGLEDKRGREGHVLVK